MNNYEIATMIHAEGEARLHAIKTAYEQEIKLLTNRLVEVHKFIMPPALVPGVDIKDEAKVKAYDALRKYLYAP